jgi:hypothetical protein
MAGTTLVLALAGVGPAMAQVQPPQERINLALARAREVGIPVALLESKIAEGKAKGVSMERIALVVERRQAALERAASVLRGRPDTQPADLSVGADALESGVSEAVLRAVAEAAPRERRVVAIAALTHLVEMGHTPAAALERVRDALKRGPEVLANLAAQTGGRRGGPGGPDSSAGGGRGRGNPPSGPPAAVPAPGESSQPSRPGRSDSPGRGGGQP